MTNAALSLSPHRLIVVVGQAGDPRLKQELAMLTQAQAALDARDVVVQSLSPKTARRDRPELAVGARTDFEVLLVGKDGGVKLRRQHIVQPTEISALIDTMPMRRKEIARDVPNDPPDPAGRRTGD